MEMRTMKKTSLFLTRPAVRHWPSESFSPYVHYCLMIFKPSVLCKAFVASEVLASIASVVLASEEKEQFVRKDMPLLVICTYFVFGHCKTASEGCFPWFPPKEITTAITSYQHWCRALPQLDSQKAQICNQLVSKQKWNKIPRSMMGSRNSPCEIPRRPFFLSPPILRPISSYTLWPCTSDTSKWPSTVKPLKSISSTWCWNSKYRAIVRNWASCSCSRVSSK